MEDFSNSIVEGRTELMVSPDGKNLKPRIAHFITPSLGVSTIDETPVANLPRHCLSSLPTTFEPKKWPLEVKFFGWRYPQQNWKTWVVKMASLHESTWKKAGIFEAIMNSTYKIERNNDLVFGIAEKWCHETKSFIFSWGETTITLEDVMILGGYSVLGSPVFTSVETDEMKETCEKLNNARKEIYYTGTCKKVCHNLWMRKFMHSDSEVEHEAFLALWLSRFVLPSSFDVVVKSVLPIAIHLARGTRIALAPAVLAKIYRDLSWLKQNIVASTQSESNCDDENITLAITLWSPLIFVQVWVWERFLDLQPNPNLIENGKPRLALWHDLRCKVQDVRSVLDSSKERFDWRPYVRKITNCDGAKFYGDKAMWISIGSSSDDELLSFARCLRSSELVGLDCIEQYLPHRVALQFGLDQDIPGCVSRSNDGPEIAWSHYNKSVRGGKLYIPPRLFEADVTTRYSEWWKQSVLSLQETSKDVLEEQRSFTSFKITPKRTEGMHESDAFTSFKMILRSLKRPKEDDTCIAFKIMPKKFKGMREGKGFPGSNINPKKSKIAKEGTTASTRPDFYLKSSRRSRWLLKQKEKDNNATSDLGSPLKRLKKLVQYPKWKKEGRTAGFVARSSERKKKGNNASIPHEFPPKNETVTDSSVSKPLKGPSLNFISQKELNNSPFPPGFPPKGVMLRAKGSANEDKLTPLGPPDFPPKCNMVEAKGSVDEDEVTPLVLPGFSPKYKMLEANGSTDEDEVTRPVPRGFPPKCNMVEAKGSVDEDEVTLPVVPGISPNQNTLEVRYFVENKVTETIERSACDHESMGNKVGRNYEKSASHRQSLSLDSHDEDQLTVAEMLKSNHKLDNVACRDAGENSSGQCQSFSSSIADNELPRCKELITTLGAEKDMAAEAASEGSKGATIQDAIESNAGRQANKTLGNNGNPNDKAASINDIEGYGNSWLNEISSLHLEARICRLERLVAEIKAARKVKSLVTTWVNLV
ncbi:hypothetical protein CRYUN_Cryun39dG0022200 [Craigia yunnanensis]